MGKGILRLKTLKSNDTFILPLPNVPVNVPVIEPNVQVIQTNQFSQIAKNKSIMIPPPNIFMNNSKRRNQEDVYKCINVMMFHSNPEKPYGNASYPLSTYNAFFWEHGSDYDLKRISFKFIKNSYLGICAWVQINGGPLDSLDSDFGISLLAELNNISGLGATNIINPFYANNQNPTKVNRWFVTDTMIGVDW